LLIISTDFVLSPVYREIDKAEVEGNRFFIHLSRVKKELEAIQKAENKKNNFLMILGDNIYKIFRLTKIYVLIYPNKKLKLKLSKFHVGIKRFVVLCLLGNAKKKGI